jgi:hypothetical protein
MKGNSFALLTWEHRHRYELARDHAISEAITCSGSFGSFLVKVPKFRKKEWLPIASIGEASLKTIAVAVPGDARHAGATCIRL